MRSTRKIASSGACVGAKPGVGYLNYVIVQAWAGRRFAVVEIMMRLRLGKELAKRRETAGLHQMLLAVEALLPP